MPITLFSCGRGSDRRAPTLLFVLVIVACRLHSAARGAEIVFRADASQPNPIEQDWSAAETTTPGVDQSPSDGRLDPPANVGPIRIDSTTSAWQVRDQRGEGALNLPTYSRTLEAGFLDDCFRNGWSFEVDVRAVEASAARSSGFSGWGFSAVADPGWGIPGAFARIGFTVGIDNASAAPEDQRFAVEVAGGPRIVLGEGSAREFHVLRAVGAPRSTYYEFLIDGVSQGRFDFRAADLGGLTDRRVAFGGNSSLNLNETTDWKSVVLRTADPIAPAPGASRVASVIQPHTDALIENGIDTATGSFTQKIDLLSVAGLFEFAVTLSHDSQLTHAPGPVGYGWSHNFEVRLQELSENEIEVRWDAVRSTRFTRPASAPDVPFRSADLDTRDASLEPDDGEFRLVLVDGAAYHFDARGKLVDLSNAAGQRLDLHYDSLDRLAKIAEPVTGVAIHLAYDSNGRLARVSDDLGRLVDLSYDDRFRLLAIPAPSLPEGEAKAAALLPKPIPPAAEGTSLVLEFPFLETEGVTGSVGFDRLVLTDDRPAGLEISLAAPSGKRLVLPAGILEDGKYVLTGWDAGEEFEGELKRGTWKLEVKAGPGSTGGAVEAATLRLTDSRRAISFRYQEGPFPAAGRILRAVDSLGAPVFSCVYDTQGRIVSQDDGRPETPPAALTYGPPDAQGHTGVTYASRLGHQTRFEYNARFQLVSARNALGHRVRHEYDDRGNRIATTDARGNRVSFAYDSSNRLLSYSDEVGQRTDFRYAPNQRWIASITDSTGAGAAFSYTNASLTQAVGTNGGGRLRMEYYPDQQLKRIVRDEYAKVDFYLDARGRLSTIGQPGAAGGAADPTGARKTYDLAGRVVETRDYDGRMTSYRFTPSSEVARITDPDGYSKSFDYDHRGRLLRNTDARGGATRHAYDGNGNLVSTTDARGGISTFEYDADDQLVASTDPLGRRTRYRYDSLGQLLETIDPLGRVTRLEYDPGGNVVARYRPDGRLDVALEHDARGLVTRVRDAFGNTTSAEYDNLGRKIRSVDATGYAREFTYDPSGRLQFTQDSLKRRAFAAYHNDKGGVPVAVEIAAYPYDDPDPPPPWETEGEALFLRYDYDYAGNLTKQDDGQVTYVYDRNNELDTIYVGDIVRLDLDYDSAGRLAFSKPLLPQFSGLPDERDRQYLYDASGQLVEVRASPAGRNQYQSATRRFYDELGRLHRYLDERGDLQTFEYDAAGNLTSQTYPDGAKVTYEYDDADRLIRVTDWAGRVTRYQWDLLDHVSRVELPNGVARDLAYNALGQLVVRTDRNARGEILVSYQYQYDPEGRIEAEIAQPEEPPPASASADYRYGYDWNRLQSLDGPYSSDFAGNITRAPDLGDLSYDRRGRLHSTDRYRYHHDQEDNLIGWSSRENPSRRTEFTIAPVGRLPRVVAQTESDGTRTIRRRYVYGLGLLYEEVDGEPLYHHQDYRGSVVALSDSQGAVVGRLAYDPYGTVARRQGRTDTLFQFAGLFGCVTSPDGMVHLRFRWYSPRARQFLQRDAFVGNISDFSRLNYFAYAGGDPISRVDPDGEFWWILAGAAVGAAVNVTATFVADLADDGRVNTRGERYGAAAVGGAVTGTIFALSGGLGGAVIGGAAGAAVENVVYASLTGQKVNAREAVIDGAIGGAGGALGYGAGRVASRIGGRVFARYGNRFASNTFKGRIVNLFRPAKLSRRLGVYGFDRLLKRSATKTAIQVSRRTVIQSGVRVFGEKVFANAFPTADDFLIGGGGDGGESGIGATRVWVRHRQSGQPDKENRLGMYRLYGIYLDALELSGQPLVQSPNYNLFAF